MIKRIGIITHFHDSINYGGVLQAFSLCKFLNDNGFEAEQILFDSKKTRVASKKTLKHIVASIVLKSMLKKRLAKFRRFRNRIPNSVKVFNYSNIHESNSKYDIFITGSDQVWNFKWFNEEYFLNFVQDHNIKLSYASSFGSDYLDDDNLTYLKKTVTDFKGLSVREPGLIKTLESVLDKNVSLAVDPTLLIPFGFWGEFNFQRIVRRKYLFCYFLGANSNLKKLAKDYAKKHNLIVVNIPFASFKFNLADIIYSNRRIYSADPIDFLSLLNYSEIIFTDSFHGVIFSNILRKNFFAFSRNSDSSMDNRMRNIVSMFNCESHFIDSNHNVDCDYISSIGSIDYTIQNPHLEMLIDDSIKFIFDNLKSDI